LLNGERQPVPSARGSALVNGRAPAPRTGSQEKRCDAKNFELGRPLRPFPSKPDEVFLHQIPQVGVTNRVGMAASTGRVKISGSGAAVMELGRPQHLRRTSASHREAIVRLTQAPRAVSAPEVVLRNFVRVFAAGRVRVTLVVAHRKHKACPYKAYRERSARLVQLDLDGGERPWNRCTVC
jgi:hypothetical protein